MVDFGQPMATTAHQHVMAVVEEGLQNLAQVHHPRHPVGVQHIHVQRDAQVQIGLTKHAFHQHGRVDIAALRFEHQANVLRRLVTHIG